MLRAGMQNCLLLLFLSESAQLTEHNSEQVNTYISVNLLIQSMDVQIEKGRGSEMT